LPDIIVLTYVGDWKIFVQARSAEWNQRVVVDYTKSGTLTCAGTVGSTLEVKGNSNNPWELRIQHDDGQHGWQNSWLNSKPKQINGSSITQIIESEDVTTSASDRDFDDLIIRLEKIGMNDQPAKPFAIWPTTVQMMPDGIFEASLGRYLMAVRIQNIWTETWPASAIVGLTQRCRQWLSKSGIIVHDSWSTIDQDTVNQEVVNGRVRVGPLESWESKTIYFKIDVSNAQVGKHNIEVEVLEPGAPDPDHQNRKAVSQIFVSRTKYDGVKKIFVSKCDRGTLTAAVRELYVDYNTLKKAVGKAREIFRDEAGPELAELKPIQKKCTRAEIELIRKQLREFLEGETDDICAIWQRLQCCCVNGFGEKPSDGETWTGKGGTGLEFFAFPTVMDYGITYEPSFLGKYGPIPFDDPWWKLLLLIIALILSLAASASAAADLANRSDDVVIGQVKRTVFNFLEKESDIPSNIDDKDPGSVDAAIVKLNGNRGLTTNFFSYLDAANNEANKTPISILDGKINTDGKTLSNADITKLFADLIKYPNSQTAKDAMRMYKSGARTGVTRAILQTLKKSGEKTTHALNGEQTVYYINQLIFKEDPQNPGQITNSGDSGSLWLQYGTNAIVGLHHSGRSNTAWASRIEDVKKALKIKFGD
jgi:hypothetical protein